MSSPLDVLHALADAGYVTRQERHIDGSGREVEFDSRVGWYAKDGGHRAIPLVTKQVRFASEWLEDDEA